MVQPNKSTSPGEYFWSTFEPLRAQIRVRTRADVTAGPGGSKVAYDSDMRGLRRHEDKHGLDDNRRNLIHRYMVEKEEPPELELVSPAPALASEQPAGPPVLELKAADPAPSLGALDRYMIGLEEMPEAAPAVSDPPRHLIGLDEPPETEPKFPAWAAPRTEITQVISSAALEPKVPIAPAPEQQQEEDSQRDPSRCTLERVAQLCEQLAWARDETRRRRERLIALRPQGSSSRSSVRAGTR